MTDRIMAKIIGWAILMCTMLICLVLLMGTFGVVLTLVSICMALLFIGLFWFAIYLIMD